MVNAITFKSHISSLTKDIDNLLKQGIYSKDGISSLSNRFNQLFEKRLSEEARDETSQSFLRMSNFGSACDRKLWYTVNRPGEAIPLMGHTRLKFLYGHILEELILSLAAEVGHRVEGLQDELELNDIPGHRDAVIDGVVIDVKSANSRSFLKYKKPIEETKDDIWFKTYYTQLQMYLEASKNDPLVTSKNFGGLLAVDQELGHLHLSLIKKEDINWQYEIGKKKRMVQQKDPPPRAFKDEPDGLSGNKKLCTYCSYCSFSKICWPEVRTFISSNGPKHLTVVKREPAMKEVV